MNEKDLHTEILKLQQNSELETLGRSCQFQAILDFFSNADEKEQWKLFPILIGLKQEAFSASLSQLNSKQLQVLQREAISEPVQRHLTVISREFTKELEQHDLASLAFRNALQQLDSEGLGVADIELLLKKIESIVSSYSKLLSSIIPALSIAWNTGRPDLVNNLSILKERCQRSAEDYAGIREDNLHDALKRLINVSFGDENDASDIEALHNDEPATEALAKFNIWYPQDYFEIGLIPQIKSAEELDLDSSKYDEEKRTSYRNRLLGIGQKNLELLGLKTVKDLREAGIFSKKTLAEYIKKTILPT
jgi:hypothetical protein